MNLVRMNRKCRLNDLLIAEVGLKQNLRINSLSFAVDPQILLFMLGFSSGLPN